MNHPRTISRRKSSRSGFTLIEGMIGVFLLSVTVAACLMSLRVMFLQMENVRNNSLASQILQSEIENLRLLDWAKVAVLESGEFDMDEEFADTHARDFERRLIVREMHPNLREVTLEVEWTGVGGAVSARRYVTYFSRNGLHDYDYRAFQPN